MSAYATRVRSVGGYLPAKVLTNADLSRIVSTTDEWIAERTGIRQRHIAADCETTSDLATRAAEDALQRAGLTADDIDLIVLGTTTPDFTFPSTATMVQQKLGVTRGAAFDVQAVCSGFIFSLATADNFLVRGQFERALVIGAETLSRILDWSDRSTCVLFGDGAGAMVLERTPAGKPADAGVLAVELRSDGRFRDLLFADGGPSSTRTTGKLRMAGNQVFKHAVLKISESVRAVAERAGVSLDEVDWFVPHQANQRILTAVARELGVDEARVVSTVAQHGNTSAASVPLALAAAIDDGRIKDGELVLMEAIGGGFTWGAALIRMGMKQS
ncbi:beta-ketoacyl-ACP synthase III [bacterium]|nr:beta-ketoacyl-ACP synthase III [bacterium]